MPTIKGTLATRETPYPPKIGSSGSSTLFSSLLSSPVPCFITRFTRKTPEIAFAAREGSESRRGARENNFPKVGTAKKTFFPLLVPTACPTAPTAPYVSPFTSKQRNLCFPKYDWWCPPAYTVHPRISFDDADGQPRVPLFLIKPSEV